MTCMKPIRIEGDVAFFSKQQLDILGPPSEYGYEKYAIVDGPPEYEIQQDHWQQSFLKPKHRYSRVARFKTVVRGLLGDGRSKIEPETVFSIFKVYVKPDSENPYEAARRVLKHFQMPHLYIHIPAILYRVHKVKLLDCTNVDKNLDFMEEVCKRFEVFENLFFQLNDPSRKYFPNLKYTALRIMEGMGVENKHIPILRTKRKLDSLEKFFSLMESQRTPL